MDNQPERQRMTAVVRAVLAGAGLGMMGVLWGAIWTARGQGRAVDWHELEAQIVIGVSLGAVVGLVLHLTKIYRSRGKLQHYLSWTLACFAAVFVFLIPAIPEDGFTSTVLFSAWLGVSGGLAFGVISRQLSGHRW